jgi:calcineurin-like phosphoesterase family protein
MVEKSFYLISDTHFNHANIINLCNRPFPTVDAMNTYMKKEWNKVVNTGDMVRCLGDFVCTPRSLPVGKAQANIKFWINSLNGNIKFIAGNHDYGLNIKFIAGNHDYGLKHTKNFELLLYGGYWLFLTHDPGIAPWALFLDGRGWVIHGHHHGNDTKNFPFINGLTRTINVSAELIDYRPISIDYLLSMPLESIIKMETIHGPILMKA